MVVSRSNLAATARRQRLCFLVAPPLLVLLTGAPALAAPAKDEAAEKVIKDAMESDYFETRFEKAEQKLRAALEACGKGCSEAMKAKLYVALGTVLAGGRKELDDGQDAFVEALKLDPTSAPNPDLASSQVQFAFEKAKAELKIGTSPAAAASSAVHKPPAEQRIHTPVPIYFEVMPDAIASVRKVIGSYAGTATGTFTPLDFRKLGDRGYGAEIPCDEVAKEGELTYFVTVLGEGDKVIATLGSRSDPLRVPIRAAITSPAPRWPGFAPPEQCTARASGPDQCLDDKQCNDGLVCRTGQCVAAAASEDKTQKNWFTITFAPDFALYSATEVCSRGSQETESYACLRDDGSRYLGTPTPGVANDVKAGFVVGTMRVALQYDRVLFDNFTAGLRVGFAFNGAGGEGVNFLPLHLEGRIGYSFGKGVFDGIGLRPFAFVSGGLAQVDAKVNVEVLEDAAACGAADPFNPASPCTVASPGSDRVEPRTQRLASYKQAGNGFATVGAGLAYNPIRNVGFHVAVRGGVTFPVVIGVIAPEVGVTVGF